MSIAVVKLGGHALDASSDAALLLDTLALDINELRVQGHDVVLVHGGGPQISELLEQTGVVSTFLDGLRVTDGATLRAVVMGLSFVNASLCASLAARSLRVVGCNGTAERLFQGEVASGGLGFVGANIQASPTYIQGLLAQGIVPVVAPFGMTGEGQLLNCNADAAAGALAGALNAETLLLLSDIDQVRRTAEDADSAISSMTSSEARSLLASGEAKDGMRPKIDSALTALEHGAHRVVIANGSRPHALRDVWTNQALQTEVVA